MINELCTLLKKSDIERNKNMNECSECKALKDELESKMKEMADQNLETAAKVRDQLSHVLSALKATQRELINKETKVVAARDSKLNSLKIVKQLESALEAEKEHKEELLQKVKELNEVIYDSKLDAIKFEQEKITKLITQRQKLRTEIVRITMTGVQNQQFQEHRLAHKNGQVTEVSKVDHSKAEPEERNSENNNEWGTKSLLKERKAEVDHSKAEAKGAIFSPK
ncbi:hypothetical protein JHK82_027998 [Glycine max]|nr:hypothetical protein JHK82_027998 [Glycine max]